MSRSLFPQWADLDDAAFAGALLFALPMDPAGDDGRRRLVRTQSREGLALLVADPARQPFADLQLELEPQPGDATWWLEVLSPHVDSVSFRTPSFPARRAWDWPLDVAVYGGAAGWARPPELAHLRRITTVDSSTLIEVLCLPLTLEAALSLETPPLLPRVHTVVVMRGAREGGEPQLLDALRTRWRADAAALISLERAQWAPWLVALTAHLAHDRQLDSALFAAARELAVRARELDAIDAHARELQSIVHQLAPRPFPSRVSGLRAASERVLALVTNTALKLAGLGVVELAKTEARGRARAALVKAALASLREAARTPDSVDASQREQGPFRAPLCVGRPGAFANARLSTFAKKMLTRHAVRVGAEGLLGRIEMSAEATFAHEIHGATEVARVRERLDLVEGSASPAQKRSVCAELIDAPRPDEEVSLAVQIRVPDGGVRTAIADQPLDEPAEWVDGESHRLHILFQDLTTPLAQRKGVQSQSVMLPATGPSDQALFSLQVPPDGTDFTGRIIVLEYPARVLQTLTYRLTGADRTPSLKEEIVARGLDALGGPRSDVSMSFIVNQDAAGNHSLTGLEKGQALVVPLTMYSRVAKYIGDELDRLADEQGGKKPFAKGSNNLELLISLALQGRMLRRQLETHFHLPENITEVQILSADPNTILPLEFCYDGTAPDDDAEYCEKGGELLLSGATKCTCGTGPRIVCPVRFWGLSRVIERHAVAADPSRGGDVLKLGTGAGRTLKLDGKVMWVMDPDTGKPAQRKQVFENLRKTLANGVVQVDTWDEWLEAIEQAPSVIAAVLHHSEDAGGSYELKDKTLKASRLDERYVKPGQLVIFLGCNTAAQTAASFTPASNFIVAGAKVVVGTYSKTVGAFAAHCASELVLRTTQAKSRVRFAEVLRLARGSLVSKGYTTAMSLVALGDADCIIERAE